MSDVKELINCPKCNQKLRIPFGKKLEVHCPTCENYFIYEKMEVINCPECNQKIRIPFGKKLEVHCPTCGNNFVKEKNEKTEVVNCPGCNQKIRIPFGEKLEVHCPICGNNFINGNNFTNELSIERETVVLKDYHMSKELLHKCHAVIHAAAGLAGGVAAGLAQNPCSDAALITTIQTAMIVGLGEIFSLDITETVAKGIIHGAAGAFIGRGIVQVIAGWIPGIGNILNTVTAAGLTEALGWKAANDFYYHSSEYSIKHKKEGYISASNAYEIKFRNQAKCFLKKTKVLAEDIEDLNKIIEQYEEYITKHDKCSAILKIGYNNNEINVMKEELNNLKKIRRVS